MKMKLLLAALFAALWTGAFAQQELTPPKFNGADVEYFMRRLVGEFEKVAVERRIPTAEIPMRVAVAFKVDSTGGVSFPMGATQGTATALGYSQSWTMSGGSSGELYLSKLEKKLLGVGSRVGARSPLEDLC